MVGLLLAAFVFGQQHANEQRISKELADACRRADGPGHCGKGLKCDHHGDPEVARARQRQRLLEQCIASTTGPDRSCPLGYSKCTHHPDWIWVREGVDYQWHRSWRRGDFWAEKDEWVKELAEAEAIYSGRRTDKEAEDAPGAVEEPTVVPELTAPRKASRAKPAVRPPVDDREQRVVYPVLSDEERCAFQSVAMNLGGYFLTRCFKPLGHDDDHVVAGGGCLGGTASFSAGTPTATGLIDDVTPIEPLPGEGEPCPVCGGVEGGVLATRRGRFGVYLGCQRYPGCTYVKRPGEDTIEPLAGHGGACPKCGESTGGTLVTRRSRRTSDRYLGCTKYPRCDYVSRPGTEGALAEPASN